MGESDKNRKKVKNRTFQTKYHYGLIHNIHNKSQNRKGCEVTPALKKKYFVK